MRLFEYEAKQVFADAGIPVPRSRLIRVSEATDGSALPDAGFGGRISDAARDLLGDSPRVIVKAQVLMGGRGKAGLIKAAATPDEAASHGNAFHSGPHAVKAVLLEEAIDFTREIYLSVSADPCQASYVILASAAGGVEIEELARTDPAAITRVAVDVFRELQPYQVRGLAYELGLEGAAARQFQQVLTRLVTVFISRDAELAEINPLFVTTDGQLVAGDGKLMIDENSLFRQPEFKRTRGHFDSDAEFEAAEEGIPYLQFDGDISLMCAGAGLTTTVFDLVHYEGGTIANYLEFGGPNYQKARRAMELCLKNDSKVILIVTFGTIARADVMARGIVEAIADLKPDRPIVTCIRGTNEEEATATLQAAGLVPLFDTEDAVRQAVAIAGQS